MRELVFEVDGQRLKKQADCDFSGLVAGSEGYLKAKFIFSSEWDGCKKAASFWVDDKEHAKLLDDADSCVIPIQASASEMFKVSVVGIRSGYKINSSKTKVRQEVF